jgi:hypothetical protein
MNEARKLARSGSFADHEAVRAAIEHTDDFQTARRWFEDSRFRVQLDRLCAMAREPKIAEETKNA